MNPQDLVTRGLTPEMAVLLTSMLPIIELRGALPLAINVFHISWPKAFLIAYIGNMIPAPFILWLLRPMVNLLSKIEIFKRFFNWLFERTRKKSNKMIEKYEEIGLMAFVAIPLPGTGAWTGALIAFLFGLDFKKSLLVIAIGVFIAGVIVSSLCLLGWIGAVVAGAGFILLAAFGFWKL
ncbi:MAG: small multi-drug export protein [candidate division WOR-3 bacterium]|nr:MAG: small multi-drug export protein [candidate division WOR-3 bacterium]